MSDDTTETLLAQISALTKIVRNTWLSLLLACAFGWLFIATVSDAAMLRDEEAINVPIVDQKVRPSGFQIATPIVLGLVMLYLQVMIARLWRLYAQLPARLENGIPLEDCVEPWLGTALLPTDAEPRLFVWISRLAAVFFIWIVPALTIVAVGGTYIVAASWQLHFHILVFFVVTASTAIYLTYACVPRDWRLSENGKFGAVWVTLFILAGLLTLILVGATNGTQRWSNLTTWANKRLDFQDKALGGKLEAVTMDKAILPSADFGGVEFVGVDMRHAYVAGANFNGTTFKNSRIHESDFSGSQFWYTTFEGTLLTNAFGRPTRHTDMSRSFFLKAVFENAVIQSETEFGVDFRKALIAGDFLVDRLRANHPNEMFILDRIGIDDLFLNYSEKETASAFGTINSAVLFDGTAFRFFDLSDVWNADLSQTFADGTVLAPEGERPCQWTRAILSDEEFFAAWRWWLEERGQAWPPNMAIGDLKIDRVRMFASNDGVDVTERFKHLPNHRFLAAEAEFVSAIPNGTMLVRDIPPKQPFGASCD